MAWRGEPAVRAVLVLLSLLFLAACASAPPKPVVLEPDADSPVWPQGPDPARYVYVGTLIGEKDFVAKDAEKDTVTRVFSWIVGLVIGERKYIELERPASGYTDEQGRVYVVDTIRKSVVVFDLPARRVLEWTRATETQRFSSPVGIAPDGKGGFYVTDSELREVCHLDGKGNPISQFGHGLLTRPTGIARDPAKGMLYVADTDQHRVLTFDPKGQLVETIGRRGTEPGEFNFPTYLAFAKNELYVADTLNFRIEVMDRGGGEQLVFGKPGPYFGDLTRPKGVAVGSDGRIYVVESYYDHLLVFDRKGRLLLPIGGSGKEIGHFYLPAGVWTDQQGRVYIADMFNGRVVVLKETTPGPRV